MHDGEYDKVLVFSWGGLWWIEIALLRLVHILKRYQGEEAVCR